MKSAFPPSHPHNRLLAVLRHTRRYAFRGQARLATDAGVTRATISRLLSGKRLPSFDLVLTVVSLLERGIGRPLPIGELFSFDGAFPTPSVCDLVGCGGCLPEEVYTADETLRPEYRHLHRGEWPGTQMPSLSSTPEPRLPPPCPDDTS